MKKLKFISSRYFICLIIMIAQICGIIALFTFLAHYAPILWVAAFITNFFTYLYIVNHDMNPEFKIPWISIVLLFPPFGSLIFALLHKRKMKRKETRHLEILSNVTVSITKDIASQNSLKTDDRLAFGKALSLVRDDPYAEVFQNTAATYYPLGEEMWKQILIDLESAKKFIFLEYFIVEPGVMWDSMLNILEEKVKSGVEVKMLFDDIGCMATLPEKYDVKLREMGIQCYRFSKLAPEASTIYNNRDHRKILVVDGKIGYTGGINLADEYINEIQKFGHWKDGGIRLQGDAVRGLLKLFMINWDVNSKTISAYNNYLSCTESLIDDNANGYFIPFGSGPEPAYHRPVGKNVFLNIINQAQYYVYITTPYLIIDYDLTTALQNASIRGVDVRIITPHVPDKKLIQVMTRTAYSALMEAGVHIYEYTDGFIHGKTVLSDDQYAIVGTINLDYRSLVHHYENAVWIYGADVLRDIWVDFDDTFEKSLIIQKDSIKMNLINKILRDCIRLFAPLL